MRIEKILGTTLERIEKKEHNIYVGLSLGNYYFTKNRVEEYIRWANTYSKEAPIIMIGDYIHAYNLEALKGYSEEKAQENAKLQSSNKKNEIKKVLNRLKNNEHINGARLIEIVLLSDVVGEYEKNASKILYDEYNDDYDFRISINSIIEKSLASNKQFTQMEHTDELMRKLSRYVIEEMPFFLNGITYKSIKYDLVPYPGIILDSFVNEIQNKRIFSHLAEKLNLTRETASIDAYVD